MAEKRQITIVSHTHWDRAWYMPFQEFRARLVRLIDEFMDILDNDPEFKAFMLDGQMAVLEDYLEVRPEQARRLQEYCRKGRIKVGPWYVLADEFLVSPEALVRNLTLGTKMGKDYGGVARIGYVPDGFGHITQLPQILRGFGLDNAFFWRGLGAEGDQLGTEFYWTAPDGSSVLTVWMPWGYHNISNLGYPIHWGDTSQMEFSYELAAEQIQKAIAKLEPMSRSNAILLMNGIDHEEADPRVPEVLRRVRKACPDYEFHHETLEDFLARVKGSECKLDEFRGEFRWGKYSEILQGVYSTRIKLKQTNHEVETLLERYAEPLTAAAWLSGAKVPGGTPDLLWTAWRWLLKNHAHDDIYGSGIDRVHDEMFYRFSQAEQIGQLLVRDSLRQLSRQVDFSAQPGLPVLAFNPLNWKRREVVTGVIDFDFDDPLADGFAVVDSTGKKVESQVIADQQAFWMETLKPNRKRQVTVAFPADVPACGYRAYFLQPAANQAVSVTEPDWKVGSDSVENRYLSMRVEQDGTLTITDKITGKTYARLNEFQDVEDAGDEYSYCPAKQSKTVRSAGSQAECTLVSSGPCLATFEVRLALELPVSLAPDRAARSTDTLKMPITSRVTVYRDQPGVYVETEVKNQARDHKLSVVFPTGLTVNEVMVDESWVVLPRSLDLPDSKGWVEDPTPLMHQRSFIDASRDGHGLAVFNRGLPSVEVTREPGGVQVSLTLLRCVEWLSRDDLWMRRVAAGPLAPTPGAQCQGMHRFEYAIYPHAGDWQTVYPAAYAYIAPAMVVRADTHEGLDLKEMNITGDDPSKVKYIPWQRGGSLPAELSLVSPRASGLVVSALTRSEDGKNLLVRLYNILDEPVTSAVTVGVPVKAAWKTDLAQTARESLPIQDGSVTVAFKPHEAVTLLFTPSM